MAANSSKLAPPQNARSPPDFKNHDLALVAKAFFSDHGRQQIQQLPRQGIAQRMRKGDGGNCRIAAQGNAALINGVGAHESVKWNELFKVQK